MADLQIGTETYRTGKLDALKQFHVARRLAPVFFALGEARTNMAALTNPDEGGLLGSFKPVAEAMAGLSDADSEYVLKACLFVCEWQQGNGWQRVMASNGALMNKDLNLQGMMQLTVAVIQENLGSFFPEAQQSA